MSLSDLELSHVVTELSDCLPGAQVQKINAPHLLCCQLRLRARGQNRILLLDLSPGRTRLHLSETRLPGLPSAPAWIMKCRLEIGGAVLSDIAKVDGDRCVRLTFLGGAGKTRRVLSAELYGNQARLLLLDDRDRLLAALIGQGKPGETMPAPTGQIRPGSTRNRFGAPNPETLAVNQEIASQYQQGDSQAALDQKKRALSKQLGKAEKKSRRKIERLAADLARAQTADLLSVQAECLKAQLGQIAKAQLGQIAKAQLGQIAKGSGQIELPNPWDPDSPPVRIELDPARSIVDNMNRLFSKSRRLRKAQAQIQSRLDQTRAELIQTQEKRLAIEQSEDEDELDRVAQGLTPAPGKSRVAGPAGERRLPYHRYVSATGKEILVGRSAQDNHQLTFQLARGSDLWFHARGRSGAHVLVRLERTETIDEQSLLDAATLAALHAGLKNPDKVEVSYASVKHLHPVKGHPGMVSVAKASTLLIRIEENRVKRLKNSR